MEHRELMEIYEENGVLRFELPGEGAVDLLPAGEDVFVAALMEENGPTKLYWPDARVHFLLDEASEVEGYEWREIATGHATAAGRRVR